ncbi:protein kinase [Undibacterium cyanobacteriorum]|uniref:Protein kinase n=1 Tax=Undibacterium cyanobacteriorum TaxID=3073561 RepID=A0ABY9RHM3_9BURK|nr:protein kinase [Undibacterium sp. 20NA77.5]WMW79797.1 protein kinase [Undibacterium sp. 20NA77.5]
MNALPEDKSQDQFLHYQLGVRLGEGGFGQVYQAWDTKLHRHVAIKYLKNVMAGVDLTREARLAASLQHVAFVKIHALEQTPDGQAIVMELVPGRTLRQILDLEAPGISAVLEIVRQIAQAMQEAHGAGLIHGDLKPSNLMQEPSGAIRILDFGLATQADRDATTSMVQADPQGTIAYMAPEILTGAALSAASDIYALGVILYELLMGKRPFAQLSGLALAAAVIQSNSEQWPWRDDLPLILRQLIRAMTERQPENRIASMQVVVDRINELLAVDPVSMQSASLKIELQKLSHLHVVEEAPLINWRRLSKHWKVGLVVASVAGITFGTWASWPYLVRTELPISSYSAANEMQNGLLLLEQFKQSAQLEKAEQHFQRILENDAKHSGARAGLALAQGFQFMLESDHQELLVNAEKNAQIATEENAFVALSHVAEALVLSLKGQDDAAAKEVERAFSLDPKNVLAWQMRIRFLQKQQQWDQGLTAAKEAVRLFPENVVLLNQLAELHLKLNQNEAALEVYQAALAKNPKLSGLSIGLAQTYVQLKQVDQAQATIQKALQLQADSALYVELGDLSFARGDYVGAAAAFENAVGRGFSNNEDFRLWAKYADTLQWIPGRTDAARSAYTKARDLILNKLEKQTDHLELMSRAALYSAKIGDAKQAQELIVKLGDRIQGKPTALFRVGVTQEILGNRSAAVEAILKAKNLGFSSKLIDADPELVALRRDPTYLGKPAR